MLFSFLDTLIFILSFFLFSLFLSYQRHFSGFLFGPPDLGATKSRKWALNGKRFGKKVMAVRVGA